jgi:hypothetical protein
MNGKGEIVSEIVPNPVGEIPLIDIYKDKDFTYFVDSSDSLSDFTIQYNGAWSDLLYISRMQGFSVGVLSGDEELLPKQILIGPNRFIFLPTNPKNPDSKLELDFKSPTPNLEASQNVITGMLANFLTSRGVEANTISSTLSGGQKTFSSAIDRLLSMVDDFNATKEDFDVFQGAEQELFYYLKKLLTAYSGTEFLDSEYWVSSSAINGELEVIYKTPEMIETTADKITNAQGKLSLGIADRVSILMDIEDLTEEQAVAKLELIDSRKSKSLLQMINISQIPEKGKDVGNYQE